jgi:GNAT superfamily N-acetyltransferase
VSLPAHRRINVRPAAVADLPRLVRLVEAYWQFEGLTHFDARRVSEQLTRLLTNRYLGAGWIAEDAGEAVGYVLAVYVFSLEHLGLTGEIDELFVLDSHRGFGTGQALLLTAEQALQRSGCTNIALQLGRTNEKARRFYLGQGYAPRPGYELFDK